MKLDTMMANNKYYIFQLILLFKTLSEIIADSSQNYMLPGRACNKLYSDLDGAVIEGNGDIDYFDPCQIQIQCQPFERWMFHVEQISLLSCNVYIEMFYSEINHMTSSPSFTFRCAEPNPGIVYTNSSYITLKLHHNNETNFRFRIVFTCRKFESPCESFLCDNGNCISPDLNCDDVDNCFDFTEEWENGTAACIEYYPFPGENFGVLISVVCVGGFVGLSAACCRMWRRRKEELHDEDLYEIKSGPYVHKYAYRYAFLKPPSHFRREIKKSDRFARSASFQSDVSEML